MTYESHEAASLFPLLVGEEFGALVDDIKARGLLNPITLHHGKVLDGRNRLAACEAAGVVPEFNAWVDPGCGPTAWVISQNLHRRHLNASQRGMVADKLANMRQGERTDLKPSASLQKVSRASAAAALHVSERTVAAAAELRKDAPAALVSAVEAGEKTITQAKREIAERKVSRLEEADRARPMRGALL